MPRRLWVLALLLMAACVGAIAWFPLLSIDALPSKDYNEGWNAYRQFLALHGQAIYPAPGGVWTTNYPPLSFYLVGLLGRATGDVVLAGRLLCFSALLATCLLNGAILWRLTFSRPGAVFTALWLFAALAAFDPDRRAVDDPELLAAAFATLGLFAFLHASRRPGWIAAAAFCFACSLFTKPDYIGFALSVAAELLLRRDGRRLGIFLLAGGVFCGLALALFSRTGGHFLLADLLQPRAYSLAHRAARTRQYLLAFFLPLGLGAAGLTAISGLREARLLGLLLLACNLLAIGFSGGDGVSRNIFFPAAIADLLAAGAVLCRLQRHRSFAPALLAMALAAAAAIPFRLRDDMAAARRLPAASRAASAAIALLRAAPGPAICEDLLLCFEAGKTLDYDPYYVRDQLLIGRLRTPAVTALIAGQRYSRIQLDQKPQDGGWPAAMQLRFTPGIRRAILREYRPILIAGDLRVMAPAMPPPPPATPAAPSR